MKRLYVTRAGHRRPAAGMIGLGLSWGQCVALTPTLRASGVTITLGLGIVQVRWFVWGEILEDGE